MECLRNCFPCRRHTRVSRNPGPDDIGHDSTDGGRADSPAKGEFSKFRAAAEGVMDVALMMANISQLRMLLETGQAEAPFYRLLLALITLSLTLQTTFAFLLIVVVWKNGGGDEHPLNEGMKFTLREILLVRREGNNNNIAPEGSGATGRDVGPADDRQPGNLAQFHAETVEGTLQVQSETREGKRRYEDLLSMILMVAILTANMFITGLGLTGSTAVAASCSPGPPPPQ